MQFPAGGGMGPSSPWGPNSMESEVGPGGGHYLGTITGSGPPVYPIGDRPGGPPLHSQPAEEAPSADAKLARMYGALEDLRWREQQEAEKTSYRRHRVNCVPALQCLFFPWLTYLLLSSIGTGVFHYQRPMLYFFCILFGLLASIGGLVYAYRTFRASSSEWFYIVYLAVAMFVAVVTAGFLGDSTFWTCMFPAYSVQHSATYNNVDPSSSTLRSGEVVATQGARYQDAGTVYFKHDAIVDTTRSVSFKLGELYCAAPIVNPSCGTGPDCGRDFWAVGIDCCSEMNSSNFQCGDVSQLHAKSGVRVMSEADRGVYRLAVLQAEGIQNIISPHPIFLYWVVDPIATVNSWKLRGQQRYLTGMYVFFFANAACLALCLKWRLAVIARDYEK